jgi:HlyD family secretion protein
MVPLSWRRVNYKNCIPLIGILTVLLTGCHGEAGKAARAETIETDEVHVASRHGGRVEKLFVQEGARLTAGEIIAELAAPELQARREQLGATLAEMEAGPRKEEIAASKHDWEALTAELEFALLDEKRAKELFGQQTISTTERDRAVTRAQVLAKSVAAARSRYDLVLAGTRPERIRLARAQIEEIDTQIRELKITAPTNCVLEVLSVKVGDVLPPQREVATLLLADHLWVRVFVPEPWLGHIKVGQRVKARTDSHGEAEFEGVIEQINRAAEFTPRNVQTTEERIKQVFGVKVRLDSPGDKLRAGMSVNIRFPELPDTVAKK